MTPTRIFILCCVITAILLACSGCANIGECSNGDCDEKNKASDETAQLRITPSEAIVNEGESFSLEVAVSGSKDLFGYQFNIEYDPEMLEFQGIEEGGFLSINNQEQLFCVEHDSAKAGLVKNIACTRMGGEGLDGSGALKKITFKALKAGSSQITILNAKLVDSKAETIPMAVASGKVIID